MKALSFSFILFVTVLFSSASAPTIATTVEGEPSANIDHCVNALTGQFYIAENDLIVSGRHSIAIPRQYFEIKRKCVGKWLLFPHTYLERFKDGTFSVAEPSGCSIKYRRRTKEGLENYFKAEKESLKRVTNTSRGIISGRTNIRNNKLFEDEKNKKFILICGDGTRRYYDAPYKTYRYYLEKVRAPNGCFTTYEYEWDKEALRNRVTRIATKDPTESVTYAWVNIKYVSEGKDYYIHFTTSTNRKLTYHYKDLYNQRNQKYYRDLYKVLYDDGREESLSYQDESKNIRATKRQLLNRRLLSRNFNEGRRIVAQRYLSHEENVYGKIIKLKKHDKRKGRVKTLLSPLLVQGKRIPSHRFFYHIGKAQSIKRPGGRTEVVDAENNNISYHYDSGKIPKKTVYRDKAGKLFAEHFFWSTAKKNHGNLLCKFYTDENDKGYFARTFKYDPYGNVVTEKILGNLSGEWEKTLVVHDGRPTNNDYESHKKKYTYTTDGYNLINSEFTPGGREIEYRYLPDSDLVQAQLIKHNGKIIRREINHYDEHHLLIQKVIDDGTSENLDLDENVTTCCITETTYNQKHLPEKIVEKFRDKSSGAHRPLNTTHFEYNDSCQVINKKIFDADGELQIEEKFEYNAKGNLIKSVDGHGTEIAREYNVFHSLLNEKRSDGLTTTYTYNNCNQETSRIIEHGSCKKGIFTEYNPISQVKSITDLQGNKTTKEHDLLGRLTCQKTPNVLQDGGQFAPITTHAKYNPIRRPILEVDGNGNCKNTTYNARGKPTKITYPDGTYETFHYNLCGTLYKTTDRKRRIIFYRYDLEHRPILKILLTPDEEEIEEESYTYDSFHLRSKTKGNITTNYEYDGAGRKIRETIQTPDGEKSLDYSYDAMGRCAKVATHSPGCPSQIRKTKHDRFGRVIEEREEDQNGNHYSRKKYRYDPFDNKIAEIVYVDGKKLQTTYDYDTFHRPIKITDSAGNTTHLTYNENYTNKQGQKVLLKTTETALQKTEELYDVLGRPVLKKVYDSEGLLWQHEEYRFDNNNNRTHQISHLLHPNKTTESKTTRYIYNSNNDLVSLIEGYDSTTQRITEYTYTKDRKRKQIFKPDGTILTYHYDAKRREYLLKSSDGTIHYKTQYDEYDNPVQIDDLITKTRTCREYDSFGNLTKERLANGLLLKANWNLAGQKTTLILPDDSQIAYKYNAFHLQEILRLNTQGKTLYKHRYTSYDKSKNPLKEELIFNLGTLYRSFDTYGEVANLKTPYHQERYLRKDPHGNLLAKSLDLEKPSQATYQYDALDQLIKEETANPHTYLYDSHNNRIEKDNDPYEIGPLNQVYRTSNQSYNYNKNGNPTKKETDQTQLRYHYDALDRLIKISLPYAELTFTYDGLHRRTTKTFRYKNNGTWTTLPTENYLYDDQNEIGMVQNGKIAQLRVLGLGRGAEIGATIALELQNNVYLPLHSIRGDIIGLIDPATKQLISTYHYSAFGELEKSTGPHSPWLFQSKRFDEETHLTYFGRRYYDPEIGRFLTPDPKGFTDIPNLYPYVLNNPLTICDLYGLEPSFAFNPPPLIGNYYIPHPALPPAAFSPPTSNGQPTVKYFDFEQALFEGLTPGQRSAINPEEWFSKSYSLGRTPPPDRSFLITSVNGVGNTLSDARENAMHASNHCRGYDVTFVHNATHTLKWDLRESRMNMRGIATEPSRILKNVWEDFFENSTSTSKIFHIAHSQGTAITYNALVELKPELQKRITVLAVAPCKFIPSQLCDVAYNYKTSFLRDAVPGANALLPSRDNFTYDNIHTLKIGNWGLWDSHSFQSNVYEDRIEAHFDEFLERIGSL